MYFWVKVASFLPMYVFDSHFNLVCPCLSVTNDVNAHAMRKFSVCTWEKIFVFLAGTSSDAGAVASCYRSCFLFLFSIIVFFTTIGKKIPVSKKNCWTTSSNTFFFFYSNSYNLILSVWIEWYFSMAIFSCWISSLLFCITKWI